MRDCISDAPLADTMDPGTILVVDDELQSLQLLMNILRAEGYHVRPADTGELALRSILEKAPDLILLDMWMPGLDGLEICRRLKGCTETRDIPLMFISASQNTEERTQGLKLGALDFISKPFQKEELLARVHTHLELGRLRSRLERRVDERTAELTAVNQQLQRELVERTLAEQRLREAEERFRNMANTAPVLIWVSGPDKLRTFFNKTWLDFTGRGLDKELGEGWISDIHADDRSRCYDTYSSSFEARRPLQIEYRLRRADGEHRWFLDTGVPRFEPDGAFAGYIGSCVDLTDVKVNQERVLASQKLESLGILAAGLAHDFNNMLGSILAEANLAFAEIPFHSATRKNIERICATTTRASEVVNLLMAYAGGNGDDAAVEAVDLSSLIQEMMDLLKLSISKKATLETSFGKKCAVIRANPTQLRRVLMNLITNASEALGDSQGFIRINTRVVRLGHGSRQNGASSLPEGEYVVLEISDTGCGMSSQALAKAFDPFYTTKSMGRGLGLSAVHGIIRSHGGAIHVVSAPGRGSTFRIFLPLSRAQMPAIEFISETTRADGSPTNQVILFVEDEETLRLSVSLSLKKNGFAVLATGDGRAALDLFRERAQDIGAIVLDLTLPDMSGSEVLHELRRIRPDAKLVVTSAYDRETVDDHLPFNEQASCKFLRKPYRLDELLGVLRAQVHQTESHARSAANNA